MKRCGISFMAVVFLWLGTLGAQPSPTNIQEILNRQKALYDKLTAQLHTTVDSCNGVLQQYQQTFNFDVSLLNVDSIKQSVEPGDINFSEPFDANDVLLILDRLRMRNNSVNQIVYIVDDEASYLDASIRAYAAQGQLHTEALKNADERFERTEAWGRKNFWRGLGYGAIIGGLAGVLLGGFAF